MKENDLDLKALIFLKKIASEILFHFRCSQFYLVLDVMNLTTYEVELHYTKSKLIQIEEGETCRIPIPIDRCPVSAFEQVF